MKNLIPQPVIFGNDAQQIFLGHQSVSFQNLIEQIRSCPDQSASLIFITGYSGAGKTEIALRCYHLLDDVSVIHLDAFGFNEPIRDEWVIDIPRVLEHLAYLKQLKPKAIIIEGIGDNVLELLALIKPDFSYFLHSEPGAYKNIMALKARDYDGPADAFREYWRSKSQKSDIWVKNYILTKYLFWRRYLHIIPLFNDVNVLPFSGWAEEKSLTF